MIKEINSVVVIGSGNVASQLAMQLSSKDIKIKQICSRNTTTGTVLSNVLNADFTDDLATIDTTADLYLLAVNDDSITEVGHYLHSRLSQNQIIAHTSGATPSDVLGRVHINFGCIWPILSINLHEQYQWADVPFAISGSDTSTINLLYLMISKLSKNILSMSDDAKSKLHLAATIVNNFSNHLYDLTDNYCNSNNLDFNYLIPMLTQQVTKLNQISPSLTQTGPAARQDYTTIAKHISLLHDDTELKQIYKLMTAQIIIKTK